MSSVAAYGAGLDHSEDGPLAVADHPEDYVRNKAESERALFRMHQRDGFPATTFRPPFIYGPGNPFYREAFFWDRLRDDRPILVPDDGNRLMHFVYVHDLVWCCLQVLRDPAAVGHAFNVADRTPVTQEQAVQAFAKRRTKRRGSSTCRAKSTRSRRQSYGAETILRDILRCAADYNAYR